MARSGGRDAAGKAGDSRRTAMSASRRAPITVASTHTGSPLSLGMFTRSRLPATA
eukprot:CAMPEP_0197611298 /NCGR_PEP_ID=MMETSP1326-20131121/55108_1 /TAXON_ID=1155430 /ORGANISM="Genus nov. species nov., Strain RCC2288" /LENGTH=54 /DNA_ID=CAMNT_0043179925 /DNA_START=292 /DNA_END=452 /DNA_ORIENTATION=+